MSFGQYFSFFSPTVRAWLETIKTHRQELLNTIPQMEALLAAYQRDIDIQFDEKQGEWTPLKKFTVEKKAAMQADPRILHETREGQGLRLRDAYKQAGYVTEDGTLVYTYPKEKPYAKDHQLGATISSIAGKGGSGKGRKKMSRSLAREMSRLDKEYQDLFHRSK